MDWTVRRRVVRALARWSCGGSTLLSIVSGAAVVTAPARAQTMSECQTIRENERRAARAQSDRERGACGRDKECHKEAAARWEDAVRQIDDATAACRSQARTKMDREPPPYANWKPNDPSPPTKDGRRYLMSCDGKVLGVYKPGGALELELKTRPGNCMPLDKWGSVPSSGGSGSEGRPCREWRGDGYATGYILSGRCYLPP
jgi:hypothetical protein